MRRLILDEGPSQDGSIRVSGRNARYILRVLRMGKGDRFRALLPSGIEVTVGIRCANATALVGSVEESAGSGGLESERANDENRKSSLPQLPRLVLLQALPKGQKMDLIVRQATEAGVSLIIPFVSERSVSRVEAGADSEAKRARWERIAREARQQSGSDVPTAVAAPADYSGAMDLWRSSADGRGVGIFLHQDPLAQGSLHGYLSGDPASVALAVGPEGGFSAAEAESFMAAGFAPAIVGANVLRTETAALFAIAAVQTVLLEKASWILKTPVSPVSRE